MASERTLLERWDAAVRRRAGIAPAPRGESSPDASAISPAPGAAARGWLRAFTLLERLGRIGTPVFNEDAGRTRDAIALNMVLLGLTAFAVMNIFGIVFVYVQKLGASVLLFTLFAVIVVSRSLMVRGYIYLASGILISGTWLVFFLLIVFSGRMFSTGAVSFAFVCVIAGMLLGTRSAIVALTASAIVLLGLAAAQALGHSPPQFFPTRPAAVVLFYAIFFLLIVALLAFHSVQQVLAAAQAEEEHYRRAIEQAVDGIVITDAAGNILLANSALSEMLGLTEDEIHALNLLDTYLSGERDAGAERLKRLVAGERLRFERAMQRKDGTNFSAEISASRLGDGRLQAIVRDVSERGRAEDALRESEERFRRLSGAAFEGIAITDHGKIVDVNARMAEMLGYEAGEMTGMPVSDLVAPEHRDLVLNHIRSGSPERYEHLALRKDGARLPVEVQGRSLPFQGRNLRITAVRDISDRYMSQEALRRSEEQFRVLFDGVRDVIFALSPDGVLTSLNAAFEEITGLPRAQWLGQPFVGLLHPEDVPLASELLETVLLDRPRSTSQLRVKTQRGDFIVGEFRASAQRKDGEAVGVLGIVRDITARLRLEEQLRQAQKMEAIGQLAGGVAHDFNNLLTAIIGYSQLLLDELPHGDAKRENVEQILNASDRAAVFTRQLLAFSRRQVLQPKVFSLNAAVNTTEKLLERLIGENVTLSTRQEKDLGSVLADEGQLEQVIVNLAINARDAMPEGGTLTIETSNVEINSTTRRAELSLIPPGAYVAVAVRDTGIGMDEETKSRVFEPFYTTKAEGKGTGLGLATAHGIVKQSGGFITVESAPQSGSTFTVYLPRVRAEARTAPAPAAAPAPRRGTETILLVEDEAGVRTVVSKLLQMQGYKILAAPDGHSALKTAATAGAEIALLITDIVMPQMSGLIVAAQLTAQRPGLKVLYMSGYADNALFRHGVLEPGIHFLQKPFKPDVLVQKVREILDAAGGG